MNYRMREAFEHMEWRVVEEETAADHLTQGTTLTFDLGQHTLELFEEQAILLVDTATTGEQEAVQLTGDESYRLYIALQEMFRNPASITTSTEPHS